MSKKVIIIVTRMQEKWQEQKQESERERKKGRGGCDKCTNRNRKIRKQESKNPNLVQGSFHHTIKSKTHF